MGEFQHSQQIHLLFPSESSRCEPRTSFCKLEQLCQLGDSCNGLWQPEWSTNLTKSSQTTNEKSLQTWTSSSFLMGILLTLYFWRNSLDKGALIITLRTCDGALKWRFRFLRREPDTSLLNFILTCEMENSFNPWNLETLHCDHNPETLPITRAKQSRTSWKRKRKTFWFVC